MKNIEMYIDKKNLKEKLYNLRIITKIQNNKLLPKFVFSN